MAAENWLQRASGLVVPAMGFADHPLGRWQPCVGPCCGSWEDPGCTYCSDGMPRYLEVLLSGTSGMDGTHVIEASAPCVWGAAYPADPDDIRVYSLSSTPNRLGVVVWDSTVGDTDCLGMGGESYYGYSLVGDADCKLWTDISVSLFTCVPYEAAGTASVSAV